MKFHHIGIAVNSIEKYYNEILKPIFGFNILSDILVNSSQNVKFAFVENQQSTRIELIEAIDDSSPTTNILKRNTGGLYHLGFISNDFTTDIESLKTQKFRLLSNKSGIAFLLSPYLEICELINNSSEYTP